MNPAPPATAPPAIARWRLLAYAGGDFAFNLYWQSVMLYLLFYYTEAVHLPLPAAAADAPPANGPPASNCRGEARNRKKA